MSKGQGYDESEIGQVMDKEFPATLPLPSNCIHGESTPSTPLPSRSAFVNPTWSSSGKGKQKKKKKNSEPQPVVYDDEFDSDNDEEENVPAAIPPPRVQHEEIELKPMASQSQPEAGPSHLTVNNHAEAQSLSTLY
ncbi:hypothetical protein EDD22DRAFT_1054191 [Suillus occidentalis]|nr:hypothetical protein EDD22DRAFT_1054191 [Suillus occidentalis]